MKVRYLAARCGLISNKTYLDTIITSFPQRWNTRGSQGDPFGILEGIIKQLDQKERAPILSVYDMAGLVRHCVEVFEQYPGPAENSFLEIFRSSLNMVVHLFPVVHLTQKLNVEFSRPAKRQDCSKNSRNVVKISQTWPLTLYHR
jgi:hypothetical protein